MGGEEQYLFILLGGEGQYPFIPLGGEGQYLFILLGGEGQYPFILLSGEGQDEIAIIRKRKRGRNILNRSGNTTDNLCFRYRFRDVFSRFRCCVYNGTGPLFVHVSVKFQLKETNVSAIVISGLHLRKHEKTLRKHVFSMFPLTYSGLLNG